MKVFLSLTLLIAGAGFMQASIIESISLNLSPLHAGSTLSGTFTLSNAPQVGDTAPVVLTFSDPFDYSSPSLSATITVETGTPSGYQIDFSPLTFTNLSGSTSPIDTKDVSITRTAFAMCASFPCTSSGGFQDRNPAVFTSTYTVSPVAVPEPDYSVLLAALLFAIATTARRVVNSACTAP